MSIGAGAGNSGHRQLRLRAVSWLWDTPGSTGSFGAGTARREVSQHPACPWQGTKSSGSALPVHPLPASSKPKATPWAKARADGEAVAMETGEKGACHGAVQPQRGHPLPGNTSSSPALARHRHQGGGRDPFARGILRPGQGLRPPGTRWMLRHPRRQRRLQRGLTPPPAPGPSGGAGWGSGGRRPAGTRVSRAGRHHLCTYVCATAHANTYVHAHVQARTARGQVHTHAHTRTRTGTQASPSPCTQRDMRTCMYMVPTPAASRVPMYVQGHRAARLHRLMCAHASTHMHTHAQACTHMYRYAQAAPSPPPQCRPPCPAAPSPCAQPLARCSAQGAPAAPPHCSRAVLCGGTRGHAARHPHRPRAEPDAREHPPSGGMKPRAAPPASQPRLAAAAAASPPARSGRCSGSWHPWAALPLNNLLQQPPLSPRRALLLRQIIPRAGVYTHIRSTPPAPLAKPPLAFQAAPPAGTLPGQHEGRPGTASPGRCCRLPPPLSPAAPPPGHLLLLTEISSSMNNEWKMQLEPKAEAGCWARLVPAPGAAAG